MFDGHWIDSDVRLKRHPRLVDQKPNDETIEVLKAAAESVMRDERERGRALDAKTAQLATFSGTILTLNVALGTLALNKSLGCVADWTLPTFFLLASGGLVVAAGIAIGGVLNPQNFLAIDRDILKGFSKYPLIATDATTVRGRLLASITDRELPAERKRNDDKVEKVKYAIWALMIGLAGIAGQAATLGLDQLGV